MNNQKTKILEALKYELARKSYVDYVELVHEGRWIKSRHLEYVCTELQKFLDTKTGNAIDILILQMPPQHGKSQSITETLPSWYLGKHPQHRIIQASYNEETAERFCRRNKEKIKGFGKRLFDIEIGDIDRSTEFELTNNVGRMISRGIMSGITSNPANLVIIDDPVKNRAEADSAVFRDRIWEEWLNTIKSRLSANAKVILIMTRWHEDDLAGRIIENEQNVTLINLPCEAEENDPIGRIPGEALFPELGKDDKWLAEFKLGYATKEGSRSWYALYQGRPTIEEGNMIKKEWLQFITDVPTLGYKLISVDAAFKDGDKNDFVAIQVWGKANQKYYLIDKVKAHLDFVGTIREIKRLYQIHKPNSVVIEDKANGSAIIQVLREEFSGVIPVNPLGGKEARLSAITPLFESGCVFIPRDEAYIQELLSFPNGKHDDEVDATSQALAKLKDLDNVIPTDEGALRRSERTIDAIGYMAPDETFFYY